MLVGDKVPTPLVPDRHPASPAVQLPMAFGTSMLTKSVRQSTQTIAFGKAAETTQASTTLYNLILHSYQNGEVVYDSVMD